MIGLSVIHFVKTYLPEDRADYWHKRLDNGDLRYRNVLIYYDEFENVKYDFLKHIENRAKKTIHRECVDEIKRYMDLDDERFFLDEGDFEDMF